MKTVYIAPHPDAAALAALFRAELPGHDVTTDAPAGPCAYAVVSRPPPGTIAGLQGLQLLLSLNAGIEHLLGGGEVPPHVPIVRMVDPGLILGMTDWVVAEVMAWHRNLFLYREQQAAGIWKQHPELMARERTLTVLGAGALGGAAAAMLAALGFNVRVWSRSGRAVAGATSFAEADLEAAVTGADALICLLPATAETSGLVNAALLARLAPGALLLNAGRGAAVVDDDVLAALASGRLSWAALDVFVPEPLPAGHPYWAHPRVIVSPHVAAPTHARTAVAVIAESIRRFERGDVVANVVDRGLGY